MRTGPGTEYDVICKVPTGEQLEVYRVNAVDFKGKTWVKVIYSNSGVTEMGWIAESQLDH